MKKKTESLKDFKTSLFGYNKEEVDSFVASVLTKQEVLKKDVNFLKNEVGKIEINEKLITPVKKN